MKGYLENWASIPHPASDTHDEALACDQLGMYVKMATGTNPALTNRGITLIEKRLANGSKIPLFQVRALLINSVESTTVQRRQSYRIQKAVLSHIVAHDIHMAWPEMWAIISDRMEVVLAHDFEQSSTSISHVLWCKAHKKAILQFLPQLQFEEVEGALNEGKNAPMLALNQLLRTKLGSMIYAEHVGEMRWEEFVTKCAQAIKDLMNLDFLQEETIIFAKSMMQMTSELVSSGTDAIEKNVSVVKWTHVPMEVGVTHIDDHWNIPLYTAKVMCCMNSEKVRLYPWDELLLEGKKVSFYPEACNVDMGIVEPIAD